MTYGLRNCSGVWLPVGVRQSPAVQRVGWEAEGLKASGLGHEADVLPGCSEHVITLYT